VEPVTNTDEGRRPKAYCRLNRFASMWIVKKKPGVSLTGSAVSNENQGKKQEDQTH
jgi:hypothetical protein